MMQLPTDRDPHRPLAAFVSIGPRLVHFEVNVANATLHERDCVSFPENIQYAWPHASGDRLYVASSNGGPRGTANNKHQVATLRIDPVSRAMHSCGEACLLASRPIHITTDIPSSYGFVANNHPSGLTVHPIGSDGIWGKALDQVERLDLGIYPHQIRIYPSNRIALLVARGHDAVDGKPEEPGALKVFGYEHGVLRARASIAPSGGYGFGPRHLDFHPYKPWIFVSLERQNKLDVFRVDENDQVSAEPLFRKETLLDANAVRARQMSGAIHVHPNGEFVYVANRALGTTEVRGRKVFAGGENSIAVYSIDQNTGEPTKIQNVDTRGAHPRTFAIDPSGQLLIAANSTPLVIREGNDFVTVPANLALFKIERNGTLRYERKYEFVDIETDMLWMSMVG